MGDNNLWTPKTVYLKKVFIRRCVHNDFIFTVCNYSYPKPFKTKFDIW